jgi:hypothetical protein
LLPARNPPPIRCPIPHRIRSASRLPKSYNRSNMQPAFSTPFPEPLPAAMPQLSEKPRHGVRSWNPAPHPGHFLCNSRTAIGLQFGRSGNVSGTVVAPSSGKSPARQQCEAQAQQTLNNTVAGISGGFKSDLAWGAGLGAASVPVIGCIGGAAATFEGGPALMAAGCVVGGIVATNPVTLTIGALQGASVAVVTDIGRVLLAEANYSLQVAACSNIP